MNEDNKWEQGFNNTKSFKAGYYDSYIQGCKNCNAIVKLDNLYAERQMIGNVYQSLCNCNKCGLYIIFDEHNINLYTSIKNKL